ncbi:thiazole tautomerase TenI [Bacillus aerolatus]|uniref:Thiazole tautomerase TenI n=1 Tax=Bacillus aerolatus TaxID=2653354 RepID=A0A6I1FIS4_9BACI|nr:thiamine phosphate synthase [Bacillus aerolatus]KAB7708232.1 thiazole tautomerase TenI [Bacillus aerolatus]
MSFQMHAITTGKQELEQASEAASAIYPFVDFIHIREKHRSAKELFKWVETWINAGVPPQKIIVNDRLDVALASGAGGVQLTESSLSPEIIRPFAANKKVGCSIHTAKAAVDMEKAGADWAILGHVFATASKFGRKPIGMCELSTAAQSSQVPVIAIGGILPHHIKEVMAAGAAGIAVMSGVFGSEEPADMAARYRNAIKKEESHQNEYSY